jgi:subtilisin family serine protease
MKRLFALAACASVVAACQDGSSVVGIDAADVAGRSQIGGVEVTAAAEGTIPGEYIVTVDDAADPVSVAASHGVAPRHVYRHLLTGFAAEIPDVALQALRLDPRVRAIEANQVVFIDRDTTVQALKGADGKYTGSWGLDRIDQRAGGTALLDGTYRYAYTGAGVRVYVVDTGIFYGHPEFRAADGTSRATFGADLMPDAATQQGADCNGHGTHVAGTVGGTTHGVAKDVRLVAVRVLSCAGSGSSAGVVAGLEWVAENAKLPAVASMSIGSGIPQRSNAYDNAVRKLFSSGVLLVMSAGNGWAANGVSTGVGYDSCLRSPSWIQVGLTVGNARNNEEKSTSSNYGDCVDIFAPGTSIKSAWHTDDVSKDGSFTRSASGTSMSTPHVSGVAALFLQQARGATPQQVKDGILSQATMGVVTLSLSKNNHMLYSLVEAPPELKGSNPKHGFACTPKRQRDGQC